jgi:hypothetical protein
MLIRLNALLQELTLTFLKPLTNQTPDRETIESQVVVNCVLILNKAMRKPIKQRVNDGVSTSLQPFLAFYCHVQRSYLYI